MQKYDRYGGARKKKKNSLVAPLSFVLVCLAIVFALGVFFRVQNIEVRGNESYTPEEIIEASGIDMGDNLFFINRSTASSHIFSRKPFVEEASIERSLPNTIIIHVEESRALAYVDWEGQIWMMTGGCKMLGSGTVEELQGLIHVKNITPANVSAGEIMTVDAAESLKLTYVQTLLQAMDALGMTADVAEIDIQNAADPEFEYLDRFTVKMGPNENTDYKLRMLLSAVMEMDANLMGTVDLSEGTAVHVSPD